MFARPTLEELRQRSLTQIQSRMGTGPLLPRSVLAVLGSVVAGHSHGLHGHVAWAARQALPTTGDDDAVNAWASMLGIPRKNATFATGSVTLTGVNGSAMPAGKRLRRSDGVEFVTTLRTVIDGGTAAAYVQALTEGALGNTAALVPLTISSPVVGISSSTIVSSESISGGTDAESLEDLRARVLQRTRQQPAAGAPSDFVRWALEVPGVTRAWCFPRFPAIGSVALTFATDDEPGGPIPTSAKVAEVFAHVDPLRPVTAQLLVFAPGPLVVDVNVALVPNLPDVRAAVEAQLRDLFRRQASPGAVLYLSHLRAAISAATGEIDSTLISPVLDVMPQRGQLPVLGSLTFQ